MEAWNDKKEKKVLRRYRFMLTLKIIRVALMILFLFAMYMLVLSIAYDKTSKGEKLVAYSNLALDWSYPGITGYHHRLQSAEISPFFTQETSVQMYRRIGNEDVHVGELEVNKPFFTNLTSVRAQHERENDQPQFRFYLPDNPETGDDLDAGSHFGVWETLEKVHEGTVADLAFSTDEFLSPEDMFVLLEDYDLDVTWMPLYMGELDTFSEGWSGGSNEMTVEPWGLTHGREYDSDYRISSSIDLNEDYVQENQDMILENMNRLYDEDKKLAEAVFQTQHFKERIDYLEENGFNVYGAVVTGPTKELLKLQEVEDIRGAQLGEVTYWNW
ncbi:anti-sigma factor [Texcoconibacillus texcoconensis]|uniref:Sigma factor regulator C-terminal domain-containing protein n=1 Tax=Texcoconibacillus texcoconensis TaxID=1095777 RepID=A0A840QI40_9BACI|nr:anti-sigma factor [Texcoconibacillus texcoconensis]MBB5172014.1 hypothetical protein [Texcoconibacillus texcoconensis]